MQGKAAWIFPYLSAIFLSTIFLSFFSECGQNQSRTPPISPFQCTLPMSAYS